MIQEVSMKTIEVEFREELSIGNRSEALAQLVELLDFCERNGSCWLSEDYIRPRLEALRNAIERFIV